MNFTANLATSGTDIDQIAMDFSASDQNDFTVDLSDYHGNVVLIDFTADWCVPCREKAETAEQFYQDYKDSGLIYILIVIDGDNKVWAQTYGLTFPVLDDNAQTIYSFYGRGSIPLPHVLYRNQVIRYKTTGWSKSEVEDVIKKYL
jgi:peroxiredoxin